MDWDCLEHAGAQSVSEALKRWLTFRAAQMERLRSALQLPMPKRNRRILIGRLFRLATTK